MDKEYIKNTINELLGLGNYTISSLDIEDDGTMVWALISTPDSRFLIGRDGEALRSLNHIVKKIIENKFGEEATRSFMIDVNGYQKKRFDNLKATAHMLAERAKYFKSNIEADPMPAFERRIIHMFLENVDGIKTESKGAGPDRRVVISYSESKNSEV